MNKACVTGGAGFIGSHVADRLRADGVEVTIVDDFRTGRREFIEHLLADPGVTLHEGDVLDQALLERAMQGCDWVFHLQANADVRHGLEHPRKDLEQNTIATANVLEAMRAAGASKIAFSSTGSVYGEPEVFPTPEDAPFPRQTSLYAASKLAGEGMIGAYAHGFGFTGLVFRFVSILGERYTHGHVYDFYCALKRDPTPAAGPRRRPAGEVLSVRQGLRRGDHDRRARARRAAGRARGLQPGDRRDRCGRRLDRRDLPPHGGRARARATPAASADGRATAR